MPNKTRKTAIVGGRKVTGIIVDDLANPARRTVVEELLAEKLGTEAEAKVKAPWRPTSAGAGSDAILKWFLHTHPEAKGKCAGYSMHTDRPIETRVRVDYWEPGQMDETLIVFVVMETPNGIDFVPLICPIHDFEYPCPSCEQVAFEAGVTE